MSERIFHFELPRGRYSFQVFVCFPMHANTTAAGAASCGKQLVVLLCALQCIWVSTGSTRCHVHNNCYYFNATHSTTVKLWAVVIYEKSKLQFFIFFLKHSRCWSNSSGDWHLFSLLLIYKSPMNANKVKPQAVSHMMDELLREFHSPLLV